MAGSRKLSELMENVASTQKSMISKKKREARVSCKNLKTMKRESTLVINSKSIKFHESKIMIKIL